MLLENTSTPEPTTEALWTDLHRDLYAFILRRVRDPSLADDLLQEVFVRVHQKLESLEDDTRVVAWVYRITRNIVIDYQRARRPPPEEPHLPNQLGAEDDNENDRVGTWLRAMIHSLPETYRDALLLAEIEGVSQKEIAQKLGLSLSGAKSRIQRGRQKLRQALLRCCKVEFDRRGNAVDVQPTRKGCC